MPYGGKDALKNTVLVKFMISRIERAYVTYDLDAADELKPARTRLGLKDGMNFCAVGQPKSGKRAIEGLLPERTISAVVQKETDLIMQAAHSENKKEEKEAKDKLKRLYLEEI